jgi:hypothetical protein
MNSSCPSAVHPQRRQAGPEQDARRDWCGSILLLAVFVTWNMLKVTFGFIERFYFPALPIIAILAPQFLRISWPDTRKKWLAYGLMSAGLALIFILRSAMMAYSATFHFEFLRFLDSILPDPDIDTYRRGHLPRNSTGLASSAFLHRSHCCSRRCFIPISISFRYPKVQERYDLLFHPFETFKDELKIVAADELLVSADVKRSLEMLSDDPNDITGMANFFFDWRLGRENVTIGYNRPGMQTALATKDIDQALISGEDWKVLSTEQKITEKYDAEIDPAVESFC